MTSCLRCCCPCLWSSDTTEPPKSNTAHSRVQKRPNGPGIRTAESINAIATGTIGHSAADPLLPKESRVYTKQDPSAVRAQPDSLFTDEHSPTPVDPNQQTRVGSPARSDVSATPSSIGKGLQDLLRQRRTVADQPSDEQLQQFERSGETLRTAFHDLQQAIKRGELNLEEASANFDTKITEFYNSIPDSIPTEMVEKFDEKIQQYLDRLLQLFEPTTE